MERSVTRTLARAFVFFLMCSGVALWVMVGIAAIQVLWSSISGRA